MRHLELDEPRHLNQDKPNRKGNKGRIRLERADRRVALEPINLLRPISGSSERPDSTVSLDRKFLDLAKLIALVD